MYSELEIREKSPLSGLPLKLDLPSSHTQRHRCTTGEDNWIFKISFFLICNKKENRKGWIPLLWFQFQCFWWTFCYLKGTERIRWWGGWGPNKISTIVTILFLILIILITDVKWQNQWWALVASVSLLLIPHTICHSLLTLQSLWWHYKCSAYALTHLARSVL